MFEFEFFFFFFVFFSSTFATPVVQPVMVGSMKQLSQNPLVIDFQSSVTLVVSNGKYILFDTGTLAQSQGLEYALQVIKQPINTVIISHGHPDHSDNRQLLGVSADTIFGYFHIQGSRYAATPLMQNQRYFLYNDPDLEIISTPGHTLQDISLIVRNVPSLGTVAIVGDLFYFANDEGHWRSGAQDQTLQQENRKKVFCMANYIIPGHGEMFMVTPDMKLKAACCSSFSQ